MNKARLSIIVICAAAGTILAGCGSGSSSTSDSSTTAAATGSSELHATVLDPKVQSLPKTLEPVTVTLGPDKISYAKGEPLKVAFVGYGKGFEYTVPEYEAASAAAQEVGAEVTEFDPQGDPQTQISQIQSAINSGKFNAMIVYPLATGLECNLLTQQAPAKGVAVVTIGYPACAGKEATPGLVSAIPDTGNPEVFKAWAEEIVELQGGEKSQEGLLVVGPKTDPNSQWATESAEEVFTAAGWAKPEIVETDYTQAGALTKIEDALQRTSNASYVAAIFPEGTAAAVTALKIAGKSEDVSVYGFGANESSVKAIEEGHLKMSVPFYPYTNVRAAYQALQLMRAGEKVPAYIPYAGHQPEGIRGAGEPFLFVAPQNAKAYAEQVEEY